MSIRCPIICAALVAFSCQLSAQQPAAPANGKLDTSRGDKMLADYFAAETKKLQEACLAEIKTLDDWKAKRGEYRRQLLEMLGLDPLPEKTDLKPVITGRLEHDEFVVEKLHLQARPGLYVTGNLYLPKKIDKPLPTILYVCGHSRVLANGVPMGAKAGYQHHGAWYAKNGYACLTIDTLQLGEIEGIHHGTHRYGMWWWLNRGYTPAGVEAWNCVRALDYLETRPEIDKTRFGVTGRSGGGAYSWWIAAIDDRIKVAVPTAGITDLQNHVVDGTVEGHCDCMFMVNTYRWDYPQVAALLAPRPLLISNTDSDGIFPLDGVVRTFDKVRRIYRLFDSEKRGTSADVALNISPGPHKDTQELNTHEFRWFNHYLKNDDSPIDTRAPKYFQPEQLKVFDKLPEDQVNTKVHETFVAKAAQPEIPSNKAEWRASREIWSEALAQKTFRGWPQTNEDLDVKIVFDAERNGSRLQGVDFTSQTGIRLRMFVLRRSNSDEIKSAALELQDQLWPETLTWLKASFGEALTDEVAEPKEAFFPLEAHTWVQAPTDAQAIVFFSPRGLGRHRWDQSDRKQVQNRRRFYLLGQSLDAMQLWDVRRAIQAIRQDRNLAKASLSLMSMSGLALYIPLFEPDIKALFLRDLPNNHGSGPILFNAERYLDLSRVAAMAGEKSQVLIENENASGWEYPQAVAKQLGWDEKQIQIFKKPPDK